MGPRRRAFSFFRWWALHCWGKRRKEEEDEEEKKKKKREKRGGNKEDRGTGREGRDRDEQTNQTETGKSSNIQVTAEYQAASKSK